MKYERSRWLPFTSLLAEWSFLRGYDIWIELVRTLSLPCSAFTQFSQHHWIFLRDFHLSPRNFWVCEWLIRLSILRRWKELELIRWAILPPTTSKWKLPIELETTRHSSNLSLTYWSNSLGTYSMKNITKSCGCVQIKRSHLQFLDCSICRYCNRQLATSLFSSLSFNPSLSSTLPRSLHPSFCSMNYYHELERRLSGPFVAFTPRISSQTPPPFACPALP